MLSRLLFRLVLGSRKPVAAGELTVTGLQHPVTIRRDSFGVPHIDAETDNDAAFALGFVQGQDRGFQLETLQRLIRGTLSELVGSVALPVDRLSRRIGFRRNALEHIKVIDPGVKAFLDAFTLGLAAGSQQGLKQVPHEFSLLKATPSTWDAADVIGYVKYMSFQLPSNWDVELARFIMLREDGPEAVAALDPVSAGQWSAASSQGPGKTGIDLLLEELKVLNQFAPRGGGSNNWLLDGTRTATGKPILASDPHLAPSLPNPWYLAHLRTPQWSVAGATFAGSPVFPIAHNGHACWGVTAGLTDTTDLFLETFNDDKTKVMQPDGSWIDCVTIRETIAVKDDAEVVEEIIETPRGPIVTPLIPGETDAISLQAVWLKSLPILGFFTAAKAKTFDEFRTAFAAWPVLPLNVLYADATGEVGYQLVGNLPRRTGGNGLMPTPVSNGDWLPEGVAFNDMPRQHGTPTGFIATANDDPYDWTGFPGDHVTGYDFIEPYRALLIRDELGKRKDWTRELCQQLHLNLRSKPWEDTRDVILTLSVSDPDAVLGMNELKAWDGSVGAESPAAAVFELFLSEMIIRVAKSKAKTCWKLAIGGDGHGHFAHSLLADRRVLHLVNLLLTQPPGWFSRSWHEEMQDALATAVRRLRDEAGPSAPYWAWGHRRMLRLKHSLLGKHRWLSRIFNIGPIPFGGDSNTIQQAGSRPLDPTAETHNIPNMRTVFDTADFRNSRFALAGGQSGNPCSVHYDDQFPLWLRGEGIPIAWSADDVIKASVSALRLVPGS
ncbi:penicillin acylase family protein [soil metagenome]